MLQADFPVSRGMGQNERGGPHPQPYSPSALKAEALTLAYNLLPLQCCQVLFRFPKCPHEDKRALGQRGG
jgi:hypothetical protein